MADNDDPFASKINQCHHSSSQEEILANSKFAREAETFPYEVGKSTPAKYSSEKLYVSGCSGGRNRGEMLAVGACNSETRDLGFSGERKSSTIEVVYDGEVRVSEVSGMELERLCIQERETPLKRGSIEPPLNKSRVLGENLESKSPNPMDGRLTPLVNCKKTVSDGEDNSKQIVGFRADANSVRTIVNLGYGGEKFMGNVKVEIVSPLGCVARESVECTEEVGFKGENDNRVDTSTGNPTKKKLEFEGIPNEDIVDGSGKPENINDDNRRNGTRKCIDRRGKRELPRSILGQVWGIENENGAFGNRKSGLNEQTMDQNENAKAKAGVATKYLLDALRMLAGETRYDDDGKVDILETAKKLGMIFPRSRCLTDDS